MLVDGGPYDFIAGTAAHRQRFAGGHGFVHGALSFQDDTVGGDFFTRTHNHDVADLQLPDGHFPFLAVHQDGGGLGPQLQQLFNGLRRPAPGRGLDVAACKMAGHDHRRHSGIVLHRPEEYHDAGGDGGKGAHGNEGIHVGAAVPHRPPGRPVHVAPCPAQHRQCQQHHAQVESKGGGPAVVMPAHGHSDEHPHRRRQSKSPGRPHPPGRQLQFGLVLVLPFLVLLLMEMGQVPGLFHGGQQLVHIGLDGIVFDAGPFGIQVDHRFPHPGSSLQAPFHPAGAGGTGHAFEPQFQLLDFGHRPVAGPFHCRVQLRRRYLAGPVFYPGLFGGEVDDGGNNPVQPLQRLFHPISAGGAGHALDFKTNGLNH